MANSQHGLPPVPKGLDRQLTTYLQSVSNLLNRVAGTVRGSDGLGVGTTQVANRTVTSQKLDTECVTKDALANSSVVTRKLKNKAVTTPKIKNEAVVTDKIAEEAVVTKKIAKKAVTEERLDTDSVSTEKIQDGAVTIPKLAAEVWDEIDRRIKEAVDAAAAELRAEMAELAGDDEGGDPSDPNDGGGGEGPGGGDGD